MTSHKPARVRHGFTLTEILVVIGLIAVMISLLLPALGKARAAANAASCLSNLRQMGMAWTMYLTENRGRLPEYAWHLPGAPDIAWRAYWPGILDEYDVKNDSLLCPAANEPIPFNQILHRGYGNVTYAWTGKYQTNSTVARFNSTTFRNSSYGYNRHLTAYDPERSNLTGGFGADGKATRINAVRHPSDVPVFLDAVFADFKPANGSPEDPVSSPPNLRWDDVPANAPDHWRFLIARHGRGIQSYMSDGSVRRVPLEETYMLQWKSGWVKYRLSSLPAY